MTSSPAIAILAQNPAVDMTYEIEWLLPDHKMHANGGRTVVDAQGALLNNAVRARPFLIKPNRYELEQLTDSTIDGVEDAVKQARKLQQSGKVEKGLVPNGTGKRGQYRMALS